jgi:hypothetical protein
MFKTWQFVLFFLLCLVFALLFNLPIQQVLPHLKLPPNIRLVGVQGTVFKGTAQEIIIDQFPLRAVSYRNMPSCIALLEACYLISYEQGTIQLAHDVLNGDTEITDTRIEYPVAELAKHVPNVPVDPVGRLELVIDNLSMVQGKPTALNGKLIWRDMGIDNDGDKINIGDYQVDFTGDQQQIDFKLSDLDASLGVAGKGEIKADGQYDIDIRIEAKTGIDPKVKNVLGLFTTKADYNKYRVEQKGRLPPNLTRLLFK